jgi:pilus assembly protein CpaE
MSEASTWAPGLPVLALLPGNDPDLILQCLRQGASEFLIRPFTADQLRAALAKLSRTHSAKPVRPESSARLYCVMPGKGSSGATTVACNLACHLARSETGKVLLADMDPLTGTLAFLLKVKTSYSFLDALQHVASLDADLWKSLVTSWQGLDVLLSPENPVDGITEACDPAPVMGYVRQSYSAAVLDTGGAFGDWNLSIARLCNEILLVTTNELAALHATQRVLAYLESNGVERAKVRLLVNRYRSDHGLAEGEIQTALRSQVFHMLPSDSESIQRALLDGKPALPTGKFGKSLAALAERLAGPSRPKKSSGLFSGLFSRSDR